MRAALTSFSIAQIHAGLVARQFSCRDLTRAYLDRITRFDGELHAYLWVDADGALRQAESLDRAGDFSHPLAGVPMALKDNYCAAGTPTTAAAKILERYVAAYDATAVARLRQCGFVLLGKTNMDEFACGSSTEYSAYGPTRNPWDLQRVPGGSSGGSAVAVAAGLACYALGSDTAGSIRQPAGFCGTVGLKPTYGRVSRYGLIAMCSSFDHVGPLTRTVADAATVLAAIAGKDPRDATTLEEPIPNYSAGLTRPLRGMRVGIPKEYYVAVPEGGLEPGVKEQFEKALATLRALGVTLVEGVSLPHTDAALHAYYVITPAELSSNLARYDGVRYGRRSQAATTMVEQYRQTRGRGFSEEIRRRVMLGTYALSSGYSDAYYRKASQVRTLVRRDFDAVFQQVDCLVAPTSPTVAFTLGARLDNPVSMYLADIFTVAANVASIPAISIPVGLSAPPGGGPALPVGLQVIGKHVDEPTVLRVASQLEQAIGFPLAPHAVAG